MPYGLYFSLTSTIYYLRNIRREEEMFSEEIKGRERLNAAERNWHPITIWQELQRRIIQNGAE